MAATSFKSKFARSRSLLILIILLLLHISNVSASDSTTEATNNSGGKDKTDPKNSSERLGQLSFGVLGLAVSLFMGVYH